MASSSYEGKKETFVAAISLFASAGTLICCALPALLVALGMGAVMAGLVSSFPQLVWISENKKAVFIIAACLLAAAGWMLWRARLLPCPIDAKKAAACKLLRKISVIIYFTAVFFYAVGFFFAYFAANLL